jgi:hypothetical protein
MDVSVVTEELTASSYRVIKNKYYLPSVGLKRKNDEYHQNGV